MFKKDDRLDKVLNIVTEIKVEQAVQKHILNEHHKRSTQLEEEFKADREKSDSRLKPIEDHVSFVNKAGKILLTGGLGAGLIKGLLSMFS